MKIAVVGGSAAGLFASLLLARAGHEILVLEREQLTLAPDVESAAASAFRPTAPQIVQPHIVMARCRETLRQRLPDVYRGLLAAGVAEAPLGTQIPTSLADTAPWTGDEQLTSLMTRRSTVDWVLLRAAVAEPGVMLRDGLRAMQLALAPLADDHRFRAVKDPEVFTAVLRTIPTYAAWLKVADPISHVFPMAGLPNTMRRLVSDGVPVATGLHAIGDSVCTTNPTLGRGLSLASTGAADLADMIGSHDGDWTELALVLDALAVEHVMPFYEDQAAIDSARRAMLRHNIFGAPAPNRRPSGPTGSPMRSCGGQRSSTRRRSARSGRSWE